MSAWERGLGQPPPQRALALLGVAWPDASTDALAQLCIGQRDARLLDLRESSFGPRVVGLADCPACQEQLELDFDVADIRVAPPAEDIDPSEPLSLCAAGYEVRFRLPTTLDVLTSVRPGDLVATRQSLLERCLVSAQQEDQPATPTALPTEVVELVEARMAEVDPQADIRLALTCPDCAHQWEVGFDITTFLWSELDAWACRTLYDVHLLASVYGWREAEVLALTPARRRFYLEAVNG
ncbi:MAG: phage baseplate protein [Egibacteraceae bacterium]